MELNNKVVIITGGLGSIGFATVQHLLRNGVEYVGILDLAESNNTTVVETLKILHDEFKKETFGYYSCDVTNEKQFTICYEEIMKVKKYVDILINAAAISNEKDISRIVDVNLKAVLNGTMVAIERMGKHKGHKGGIILNFGSFFGLLGNSVCPTYSATKAAIITFVISMKEHSEMLGVQNYCICPGLTKSNLIHIDNIRKSSYDFVDTMKIRNILDCTKQSPNNVASAIIQVIKEGKNDVVWLVKNDEPAIAIDPKTDNEKFLFV